MTVSYLHKAIIGNNEQEIKKMLKKVASLASCELTCKDAFDMTYEVENLIEGEVN